MPTRSPRELQNDIHRATLILEHFTSPDSSRDVKKLIPPSVLANAHGIVFIRFYKAGFCLSAKSGTGIIIARLPDGSWSAPSGVSMLSIGVGQQLGGQLIDSIIVMNYRAAVKAFYDGKGQLQLGMAVSVAAGPYGRSADVAASASSTSHIAATYTYSASKGFYIGYSLEGARISDRPNTNMAYYRQPITAKEILTGHVQPPQDAVQLYDILNSLGAGPRPGLPFAPKKSQNSLSTHFIPTAPNQQELEASAPPPQLTHSNSDLPPPPYAAYDQQLDSGSSQESIHNSNITISRKDETQPRDIKQLYNWYQPSRDMLKVVIATYDFTANEPTELSFKAGDMIIVLNRFESRESWWEGQIGGRRGYFPANYTKDLTD